MTPTIAPDPSWGRKSWTTPSSASCRNDSRSFLAFIASCGQGVADAQFPMVRDAHHVARIGLHGQSTVLGEEELRGVQADGLARSDQVCLHAAPQPPGADPHEGDAVAMIRVHVRLD